MDSDQKAGKILVVNLKELEAMRFDAERFLSDAGIQYRKRGVNVPRDAVNINCIYCGETRFHLVVSKTRKFCRCWVCKKYVSTVNLVVDIAKCSWNEARKIVYGDKHHLFFYEESEREEIIRAEVCRLPKHTRHILSKEDAIQKNAKRYLMDRQFSIKDIEQYDLHYGYGGEQAYRIVIPMYFGGRLVTYTGRDFTGQSGLRYKSCKVENSVLIPTEFLYGADDFEGHKAFIVEGAFDKIAMRNSSFLSVSTNKLTGKQKSMLCHLDLNELIFIFDAGTKEESEELASYFRPVVDKVKFVDLKQGDPASKGYKVIMKMVKKAPWFDF